LQFHQEEKSGTRKFCTLQNNNRVTKKHNPEIQNPDIEKKKSSNQPLKYCLQYKKNQTQNLSKCYTLKKQAKVGVPT
jgi:hypothetical protein